MFFSILSVLFGSIKLFIYKLFYMRRVFGVASTRINNSFSINTHKGCRLKFGKGVRARNNFNVYMDNSSLINIGNGVFFNNDCSINSRNEISIGNNTIFGENVKIYDHNHIFNVKNELIKNNGFKDAPVTIGENTWIGSSCIILKGAKIGNNCVISANTKIDFEVPDNSLVRTKEDKIIIEKIIYKER